MHLRNQKETAMPPDPEAQSGVFIVDLSGLNLSLRALKEIENEINKVVEKRVAGMVPDKKNVVSPTRLEWLGKVMRLRNPAAGGL
jgi:hypothetical protein